MNLANDVYLYRAKIINAIITKRSLVEAKALFSAYMDLLQSSGSESMAAEMENLTFMVKQVLEKSDMPAEERVAIFEDTLNFCEHPNKELEMMMFRFDEAYRMKDNEAMFNIINSPVVFSDKNVTLQFKLLQLRYYTLHVDYDNMKLILAEIEGIENE